MAVKSIFEALESRTLLATITVDSLLDVVDAGDGVTTLREAVTEANTDAAQDTIEFDPSLAGGTIYLFQGEIAVTESLIVSGLGSDQLTVDPNGSSRVFNVTTPAAGFEIRGVTLNRGSDAGGGGAAMIMARNVVLDDVAVTNSGSDASGGGLYINTSLGITFTEVTLSNNTAAGGGGAVVAVAGGNIAMTNVTATGNSSTGGQGGAFYNYADDSVTLTNVTLEHNTAVSDGGGAFNYAESGDIVLSNVTANNNVVASGGGGALFNYANSGDVTLTNSTFSENTAYSSGGAVYTNANGSITQSDITAERNLTSSGNGGALYNLASEDISLSALTLHDNSAGLSGGAVHIAADGDIVIDDVTATGNATSEDGGALFARSSGGSISLSNATFDRNVSGSDGGGAALNNGYAPDTEGVTLTNVTAINNLAESSGGGIYASGAGFVLANNLSMMRNFAERRGGGALLDSNGTLTLRDSTFIDNVAGASSGGGFSGRTDDDVVLENIVANDNYADDNGGGFELEVSSGGNITATNIEALRNVNEFSSGGGISLETNNHPTGGNITLSDVVANDNSAGSDGGGVHVDASGHASLTNVMADGNVSGDEGGGVHVHSYYGDISLTDITARYNVSDDDGGGIFAETYYGSGGSITLTNILASFNVTPDDDGGGLFVDVRGDITGENITLNDNSAPEDNGGGGTLETDFGDIVITGLTANRNDSGDDGGGVELEAFSGDIIITDFEVLDNRSEFSGGGLAVDAPSGGVFLSNGVATGNISGDNPGGAIDIRGDDVMLTDIVATNNRAGGEGGGIRINSYSYGSRSITLMNVDVSDNVSAEEGGGLAIEADYGDAIVSLTNVTANRNEAAEEGGGINLAFGYGSVSATLTNVEANDNIAAQGDGGGIYLFAYQAEIDITYSNVMANGNTAGDGPGGGIYNYFYSGGDSSVTMEDVEANDNEAAGEGGGIANNFYNTDGDVSLTNVTANNNIATGNRGGGGIFNYLSGAGDFTLTNVTANGNQAAGHGGGVYGVLDFGTATLTNVEASDNFAGGGGAGGGINLQVDGEVVGDGLVANDNRASDAGGGVYVYASYSVSITNAMISRNSANGAGGGLYTYADGNLTLTNVIANDNVANAPGTSSGGGGAFAGVDGDIITVLNSEFNNNQVIGQNADGGGLYAFGAVTLRVTDTDLIGNSASAYGGGLFSDADTLRFINSTASNNRANMGGGGVFSEATTSNRFTNATVSGNVTGGNGGGLHLSTATTNIYNSTIYQNRADADATGDSGGGVWFDDTGGGTVLLVSSIVASNNRGAGNILNEIAGTDTGDVQAGSSHNWIRHPGTAGGLTNGDNDNIIGQGPPDLLPLADYGGPTQTHRPSETSPVLNQGLNALALQFDQRGMGFDRERAGGVDIGAHEKNVVPTIGDLSVGSATLVQNEAGFMLMATGASDGDDGDFVGVRFYADLNGDGVPDENELLGEDADGSDGFSLSLTEEQTLALPVGDLDFLATAFDFDNEESSVVSDSAEVLFTKQAQPGGDVNGTTNASNQVRAITTNAAGDVLAFEEGSFDARQLSDEIGAPAPTGEIVTWTDPKDGLVYAAYTADDGLIVLQRAGDGTWSFQNVSDAVPGSKAPVGDVTQFLSVDGFAGIAGFAEDGDLVAFIQNANGFSFEFDNISSDLSQTPVLTDLISYVPAWNAWSIAGLDENGEIISVFKQPGVQEDWALFNLSEIAGTPALEGGLTSILTSWDGINLTGLDGDGNVITTWWVPSFGGDWTFTDLTANSGGPALSGGETLSGYYTEWDAMNYAGYDADGDLYIYWWVPGFDSWVASNITDDAGGPTPTGDLSSHVSVASSLNIFGADEDGNALRTFWEPGFTAWQVENLSDIAERA